jgi:transcriptional regulator with XRE-family HTH domain
MRKVLRSPDRRALLEVLVAARKKAGLTQAEVARKVLRPQSFVAKYENGERRLDVLEFIALSDALGVNPIGLFRKLVNTAKPH